MYEHLYAELRKQSDSDSTGFSPKTHEKLLEVAFSLLKVPLDDEDRKHANVRMPRALAQINLGLSQYKETVLFFEKFLMSDLILILTRPIG